MRLAVLILLLATVSMLAFRSEGIRTALAVRAIAPGMTLEEAEAVLAPRIVARGFTHGMGCSGQTFYYHLKGGLELEVDMGRLPNSDRIDIISSLRRKRTWDRIFWEPTNADRHLAFEVALKRVEPVLDHEEPQTLGIRFDYGRWRTHRLLDVTLEKESGWQRSVTVDLDEGRVVPTHWVPTAEETARARVVADAACRKFLSKEGKLEVRVDGEYGYVPLRRLVSVSYQIHGKDGTSLDGALVDIDAGKLFEWPD